MEIGPGVERLGIGGIEPDRLVEVGPGLFDLTGRHPQKAAFFAGFGVLRIEPDGPFQVVARPGEVGLRCGSRRGDANIRPGSRRMASSKSASDFARFFSSAFHDLVSIPASLSFGAPGGRVAFFRSGRISRLQLVSAIRKHPRT